MTDGTDRLSEPDLAPEAADPSIPRQRLLVVSPPASRSAPKERPITSLAAVFGRFADLQQQVGDQVMALEDSVEHQGQQLGEISSQLPDMRERINWLIASYYEDDRQSAAIRERLSRQEAGLATLTDAVRSLCDAQAQWKQSLEQLMQILGRAQSVTVAAPPRWPE